jgi:putative PIN family toxin of toxin-antitoxin system
MTDALRLVLDTNVVIDWLAFDDPYMTPLRARAAAGTVVVLTHDAAIAEFERVLGYPELRLIESRRVAALARYRAQTQWAAMPAGFATNAWQLPAGFPSCRDRDDDLFLALAYHSKANALVTRDKVLLKMRKRVRKFGVAIWDVQQMIALLVEDAAVSALASS